MRQPVNATRTGRSILVLSLALALTAAAVDPLTTTAATGGHPDARVADACAGTVGLAVSDRRPRQLLPVRFGAVASTVPPASVAFYDFNYGDGSDDAGALPTAVHAYAQSGNYLARVSIVTTCDTVISSGELHVDVVDGLPPAVTIGFPHASQTVHFGQAGLLLTGTATDPSGVRKVELAMQILSVKRAGTRARAAAAATQPGCYWYDGKLKLRLRGCARPLFFPVHVHAGHWSFRMNPRSQIPPGVYTARVRATDRVGNITSVFSPKLGNILAFLLVA
jgi:hypothetical protein